MELQRNAWIRLKSHSSPPIYQKRNFTQEVAPTTLLPTVSTRNYKGSQQIQRSGIYLQGQLSNMDREYCSYKEEKWATAD